MKWGFVDEKLGRVQHSWLGFAAGFDSAETMTSVAEDAAMKTSCKDRKTRCNMKLSDIPESHVHTVAGPALTEHSSSKFMATADAEQEISKADPTLEDQLCGKSTRDSGAIYNNKPEGSHIKRGVSTLKMPVRWVRDKYIGCLQGVDATTSDMNLNVLAAPSYNTTMPISSTQVSKESTN